MKEFRQYFNHFTIQKGIFYIAVIIFVLIICVIAVVEPFISLPCDLPTEFDPLNPFYEHNPCQNMRYSNILYLSPAECTFGRRLVAAVILGSVIGWERQQDDRPAGIHTMSLVSLGSSLFTICSVSAFQDSPMKYDASRISAAIPCGVGFLGAGLIWKRTETDEETGLVTQVVHGLKTAASVWLSAAVGIACGGGVYFAAFLGTCLVLLLLRFSSRTDDLNTDLEDLSGYGTIPKENSKNIQKKLNMDNNDFEDSDTDDLSSDLENMLDYGTIPKQDSESIEKKLNYDFSGS